MLEDEQRNGSFNFCYFSPLALLCLVRFYRRLQSWTKLTENLNPPPFVGKWCVFAASFLILRGWLFAIPLYSAQDCNLRQNRPKTENAPRPPPPQKNRGWENCAFWPSRGFILDFWVVCCFIFSTHRILITSL